MFSAYIVSLIFSVEESCNAKYQNGSFVTWGGVFSACIVSLIFSVKESCNAKYQNGSFVTWGGGV